MSYYRFNSVAGVMHVGGQNIMIAAEKFGAWYAKTSGYKYLGYVMPDNVSNVIYYSFEDEGEKFSLEVKYFPIDMIV
jgi:hypothetical protein